jgi:hypothetical protein
MASFDCCNPKLQTTQPEKIISWWCQIAEEPFVVFMSTVVGARQTIAGDGSVSNAGGSTGYTVIIADDLGAAVEMAKGCPVLGGGGNVEVSECIDM